MTRCWSSGSAQNVKVIMNTDRTIFSHISISDVDKDGYKNGAAVISEEHKSEMRQSRFTNYWKRKKNRAILYLRPNAASCMILDRLSFEKKRRNKEDIMENENVSKNFIEQIIDKDIE